MTTPSRCSDDLLEAMRAGNVSLADTARAAQEPPDVQRKALEDVLSGRAPTLTTALTPETPPTAERLTLELTAEDVAHLETVLARRGGSNRDPRTLSPNTRARHRNEAE